MRERATRKVEPFLRRDPEVVLWWGTALECMGVLARQEELSEADMARARAVVEHLRACSFEVQPTEEVRSRAMRALSAHRLSTAAALQLAAALVWCGERPQGVSFVCLDEGLRHAAAVEGFLVVPYAEEVHEPEAGLLGVGVDEGANPNAPSSLSGRPATDQTTPMAGAGGTSGTGRR